MESMGPLMTVHSREIEIRGQDIGGIVVPGPE
jgi:hypothetical protein